jgi:hypothetical protein
VLKEQQSFAGAKPYLPRIEEFRSRGLWDETFSLASITPRQWAMIAFPILNSVLSALYLVSLLLAIGGIVAFDRTRLREPIFLFCVVGSLSVSSSIALLQYEPRQANVLYPLGMPLIVILLEWIARAKEARLRSQAMQSC